MEDIFKIALGLHHPWLIYRVEVIDWGGNKDYIFTFRMKKTFNFR